jgi:DNA-directed RNA polymerase subunit RPC12/RpoP
MAKRKYICPSCGKKTGANILYGLPAWDLVQKDVEEGYLVLGGCCQDLSGPERECTSCGHQWRIKRRKPTYTNEINLIPDFFAFDIGGFADTNYRVDWLNGVLTYSKGQSPYHKNVVHKQLGNQDWERFWSALLDGDVHIWGWKNNYFNPSVLDGTEWSLELHTGENKKKISGFNAFPGFSGPDWRKSKEFCCLISAIGLLIGEMDFFE